MPALRPITLAIQRFDRTAALHTGKVPVRNVTVVVVPAGTGVAGLVGGVFDAAEMPLAHYAFLRDQGEPFSAIPVFPDRIFLHQYVYTRRDAGLQSPEDLRGRRVAVPQYYMTSSIWHRGILKDDYSVLPEEIQWTTTSKERDSRMGFPKGVNVAVSPGPHWGAEPLLDGTVDCLMHEGMPMVPENRRHQLIRLYPDAHSLQREFYRKTGFHVIVHVIVVRKEVLEMRPGLPDELSVAFDQAKQCAYDLLQNERMTSLPLMRAYLDDTVQTFGEDPWPYGFEKNRSELAQFLAYAQDQGLTQKRLEPEELFDAPFRDFRFESRMRPHGVVPGSGLSL